MPAYEFDVKVWANLTVRAETLEIAKDGVIPRQSARHHQR